MGSSKKVKKQRSLIDMVTFAASDSMMFAADESPFRASCVPGAEKLAVVVGENASGKSLLFRIVAAVAQQAGMTPVTVSIRERTGAGLSEMAGMRRAFMFGDELDQSTGATSVKVVGSAFRNLERDGGSILGLDEPELGLSDGYARALGEYIGQRANEVPGVCAGTIVVTHNRQLIHGLLDGFGGTPTFVHVGGGDDIPATLFDWLADVERRSVDELLALPELNLERWRIAGKLIKS